MSRPQIETGQSVQVNIRITLAFCLISGLCCLTSPTRSSEPPGEFRSTPTILLLSLARCCPEQYWADGEKALQEELQTLDVDTRLLFLQMEHFDATRPFFLSLQHRYGPDVVVSVSKTNDSSLRADILSARTDEQLSFRQMHFSRESTDDPVSTVNLRVIEAVRASLLRVQFPTLPTAPPRTPAEPPLPTGEVLRVRAGATILQGPGQNSLCAGPYLGLGVVLWKQLMLEGNITFGAACSAVAVGGHSANFTPLSMRGFALWIPGIQGRIRPEVGLGAGFVRVWSSGQSDSAHLNQTDGDNIAWLGGTIRMTVRLSPMTGISLGGTMGTTLPVVEVYFNNTEVADWGRPLLEGHISLELRFL